MKQLMVIVDRESLASDAAWLDAIDELSPMAVELQLRAKSSSRDLRSEGVRRALLGGARPILNGSIDDARNLGAGGAHMPEALLIEHTNAVASSGDFVIGASIHSATGAHHAATLGLNYVIFGPVFDAGSKPVRGVGTEALKTIARSNEMPVLAVGGIKPNNVADVMRAGARGVAVITSVLHAADRGRAVNDFLMAFRLAESHSKQFV